MRNALFFAILGVLLSGCVQTEVTRLDSAPSDLTPVKPSDVYLYADTSSIECEYERVAFISSTEYTGSDISRKKLAEEAKPKAGEIGANALVLEEVRTEEMRMDTVGEFLAIYERRPCDSSR